MSIIINKDINGEWTFYYGEVDCNYDNLMNHIISDFIDGYAKVHTSHSFCWYDKGPCGVIDDNGKIIIPFDYDFIEGGINPPSLEKDIIKVSVKGKYGWINKNNEIVIPLEYDIAIYLGEGVPGESIVMVSKLDEIGWNGKYYGTFDFINTKSKNIITSSYFGLHLEYEEDNNDPISSYFGFPPENEENNDGDTSSPIQNFARVVDGVLYVGDEEFNLSDSVE